MMAYPVTPVQGRLGGPRENSSRPPAGRPGHHPVQIDILRAHRHEPGIPSASEATPACVAGVVTLCVREPVRGTGKGSGIHIRRGRSGPRVCRWPYRSLGSSPSSRAPRRSSGRSSDGPSPDWRFGSLNSPAVPGDGKPAPTLLSSGTAAVFAMGSLTRSAGSSSKAAQCAGAFRVLREGA